MTLTPAVIGAGIRATNVVGSMLSGMGFRLVSLDERDLLDAARRATGLEDFGDDDFREPFRRLLAGLETEADLTLVGRIAAHRDLTGLLVNRLRLEEDRTRHPEIASRPIAAPIFIVGLPRSGSTLLHHLLGQDPDTRVPQAWEVMYPSPPPTRAAYETDPRIERAARQLRWLDWLAPDFKAIHPVGARLPLECIAIMSASFRSTRFQTTYNVPSYEAWLAGEDMRPAYAFHRRFLQHLQWRAPGVRWVLKAPAHVFSFDALLDTYPDARIVHTHRDPVTSVAPERASVGGAIGRRALPGARQGSDGDRSPDLLALPDVADHHGREAHARVPGREPPGQARPTRVRAGYLRAGRPGSGPALQGVLGVLRRTVGDAR